MSTETVLESAPDTLTESNLLRRIRVLATRLGARLFRNNVGVAEYPNGQRVRYGLAPGSSDLIGWTPVRVTPQMLGSTVAVFTAVEVKGPRGRASPEQANFIREVERAGGIAVIARSENEVMDALTR